MVDYAIANQIRPFQLPDAAGIAGALQGLELNRMRSQQLQAAEQERNALRQLMATPGFDPSSPDAARRLLEVAPTTGAATYQALMAGQREQRQASTAQTEALLKNFDLSRQSLRGIAALPAADRPAAWAAWRAQTEAALPTTRGFIPADYSDAAYTAMISQADDIAKNLRPATPVVTQVPGSPPFLTDPHTGITRPATEANAAPAAPGPRAEAPSLGEPGRDMAAALLRRSEGFRAEPYMDVNALRTGYGSDTITTADGRVLPVTQGTRVTQEDAERDLARRIPEFERRAATVVGEERFAALPPNVRAALISVAYNYGTLPVRVRNAVQSGDVNAIAAAVEGLAGDNQGINARRRSDEAAVIRGANAMAPGAATTNAMLAPPDATAVSSLPQLPSFAPPRTLAEADYQKRILDAALELEKKRLDDERARRARRAEQPERVQEAGQTSEAQTRGRLTAEQEREERRKQEGREKIEQVLNDMKSSYENLERLRGIPSERRGALENIPAYLGATPPGQEVSKALATQSQSQRNALQASARQLLTAIKAATGMSAQEMNSNVELQQLMSAISSPTQSIESVREILSRISRNYGLGRLEFGAPSEAPAAAPTPAAPREGVPGQRRGAAPTQGQYQEGQTATGPNGQRVIFRNGQWVPVQ
jgi:GH24 family phage-related lysozyme (muramidase)/ribosomal protein S14